MSAVLRRVTEIVAHVFGEPVGRLTPETRFVEDLAASLDFEEAVIDCEQEFGVPVPDEDAGRLLTIGQLAAYIEGRLQGKDNENVWPPAPQGPG